MEVEKLKGKIKLHRVRIETAETISWVYFDYKEHREILGGGGSTFSPQIIQELITNLLESWGSELFLEFLNHT